MPCPLLQMLVLLLLFYCFVVFVIFCWYCCGLWLEGGSIPSVVACHDGLLPVPWSSPESISSCLHSLKRSLRFFFNILFAFFLLLCPESASLSLRSLNWTFRLPVCVALSMQERGLGGRWCLPVSTPIDSINIVFCFSYHVRQHLILAQRLKLSCQAGCVLL